MASLTCPKCQAEMQEGFIPEFAHANRVFVSRWVAGSPPDRGPRKGTAAHFGFWWGISLGRKPLQPIVTYRCLACGYLESYAR